MLHFQPVHFFPHIPSIFIFLSLLFCHRLSLLLSSCSSSLFLFHLQTVFYGFAPSHHFPLETKLHNLFDSVFTTVVSIASKFTSLTVQESKRRQWTLHTIDSSPFQVWVVIVAGIGFLTDAFDIFALNGVTPMLGYVFYPNNTDGDGVPQVPKGVYTGMLCATLAATMIGQIVFGFGADVLGRRKMYGLELVIVIVGTILMVTSSNGERNSMNVAGWLITWRAVMGFGIGADYPLSAVITSEFAPRRHRARMLCWVFFSQAIGQLLANVICLAAIAAYKPYITDTQVSCGDDIQCYRAVDKAWRLVVGLGAVPAVIALAFRFTIPESPRYKLDIQRKINKVFKDTQLYYGQHVRESEMSVVVQNGDEQHRPSMSSEISPDEVRDTDSDEDGDVNPPMDTQPPPVSSHLHSSVSEEPPQPSREDIKTFFIKEGNWRYLLGTSLSWAFLDFAFYGLGLSSPKVLRHIWHGENANQKNVYSSLKENSEHTLIMVSIGAVVGGAAIIKLIKYVSPRVLQLWGFVVLFVLFIVTGSAWTTLLESNRSGVIVLYVLCHIAFNLGPNTTTFIVSTLSHFLNINLTTPSQIPAEIFPTRYRCTCHGISAAAGKLGSWLAQIFVAWFKSSNEEQFEWVKDNFGHVLQIMSAFMLAGAVTTYFLVPETRDGQNRSRSLEELARGRVGFQELERKRRESVSDR